MKVKIHREGLNILIILLLILLVINIPVWLFIRPAAIPATFTSVSAIIYLLVLNFFRSPRRQFRGNPDKVVVASADGKVDGEVLYVKHHSGRFLSAWLPKSSTENERSTVAIRSDAGPIVLMRQVAGALARRIVTYACPGERASIEQHMGFIKFGSRIDLYLPLDSEILVKLGDKTIGGVTEVARLK